MAFTKALNNPKSDCVKQRLGTPNHSFGSICNQHVYSDRSAKISVLDLILEINGDLCYG